MDRWQAKGGKQQETFDAWREQLRKRFVDNVRARYKSEQKKEQDITPMPSTEDQDVKARVDEELNKLYAEVPQLKTRVLSQQSRTADEKKEIQQENNRKYRQRIEGIPQYEIKPYSNGLQRAALSRIHSRRPIAGLTQGGSASTSDGRGQASNCIEIISAQLELTSEVGTRYGRVSGSIGIDGDRWPRRSFLILYHSCTLLAERAVICLVHLMCANNYNNTTAFALTIHVL